MNIFSKPTTNAQNLIINKRSKRQVLKNTINFAQYLILILIIFIKKFQIFPI
jgi:hypothetical protein